ncbi:4Fe-4S dicluster domain-containing protein [Oceanidesulfovibrio marinus]|uniref:Hydrogenase n=1 Tax=Oceanidesulfovibrio marinus TaxID=370038 RepID=A0ABX6NDP6_9BACT|nr:4Fe-4S dicluster domain-containing protein [Oceanidesulfovibrio marinus]QJT08715.1 hydrogenase [Oceanidesulfovibrio marinus]QJT09619.1 hydrogenase [Oceanidesulfovibrio marinus]
MNSKYIPADKLTAWLDGLAADNRVLVPVVENGSIVFRPREAGSDTPLELEKQATVPPKNAVFPASEPLLTFSYQKHEDEPEKVDVSVQPTINAQPTVVFGCRPCDARGFTIFDNVYGADIYYESRREKTAFISQVCKETANTCFCHWTGEGPADSRGSDVLAVPVDAGYVLEPVTEKGEGLLTSSLLADASKEQQDAAAQMKKDAREQLGEAVDVSEARGALLALFDNMEFWEDVSAKCISCGACTYLCPTCYCFNITDETCGSQGHRVRSWDNCMSYLFTLEGSGHNPRPTKAHRLKNRVGHKFSYYPGLHDGLIACCGCGRCIKSCPVSVDIREIVQRAIETAAAETKAS